MGLPLSYPRECNRFAKAPKVVRATRFLFLLTERHSHDRAHGETAGFV